MNVVPVILFLFGLGAAAIGLIFGWAWWRERRDVPDRNPAGPLPFGSHPRVGWLAIRGAPPVDDLARALRLRRLRPIGWPVGLHRAFTWQGSVVFITPPMGEWTFIVNDGMAVSHERLAEISAKTGTEVQWFQINEKQHAYSWGRATGGRLARWYVHAGVSDGESLGEPDALESATLDRCAYDDEDDDGEPVRRSRISESVVREIAAAWSADPGAFERERPGTVGRGWIAAWG